MRLLVVEDDPTIAAFTVKGLRQEGFTVDHAETGPRGLALARAAEYDAAVIDVMLPEMDGLRLVKELRTRGVRTPVLFLSALSSVEDRVKGLETGGDDYLVKPFAFAELLARVQALIRRSSGVAEPTRLTVADLSVDRLTRTVLRGGRPIDLRPRELTLLELLMRHAGRPVSKMMILSHVWGYDFDPRTNVVDVLVHRLREKIDKGFEPKLLHTARGIGYVLKVA